jgi:hypothetical protein
MKPLTFCLIVILFGSFKSACQTSYIPAVTVTYDNAGNRLVRQIKTICVGIGCDDATERLEESSQTSNKLIDSSIKVKAYPNPINENLFVENLSWNETDKVIIKVYNMNGNLIINQNLFKAKGKISFLNFPPGSYIVEYFLNDLMIENWKIIKP